MVASGAVCGDAFPGNGLPVRGLWSLIPVLVAFPLILCQQPPVTDVTGSFKPSGLFPPALQK
ncbi:Uncharacterised protein [Escherichia coli]|nr:Uncharacterised protein [Escherichia coli]CTT78009.1 Uncharacterised protein [Escherichia coli]CTZ51607.1 Uncharacterised protein [Escherichia coli]